MAPSQKASLIASARRVSGVSFMLVFVCLVLNVGVVGGGCCERFCRPTTPFGESEKTAWVGTNANFPAGCPSWQILSALKVHYVVFLHTLPFKIDFIKNALKFRLFQREPKERERRRNQVSPCFHAYNTWLCAVAT